MNVIYLLAILIAQFSPQGLVSAMLDTSPATIHVEFVDLHSVEIGAPVFAQGQRIGTVLRIEEQSKRAAATSSSAIYDVAVAVPQQHVGKLQNGTVGLITSPVSRVKQQHTHVIELFGPGGEEANPLQDKARINGYSSYVDFWSSESSDSVLENS